MGVFVNAVSKTLSVCVSRTHWLYKNDFRFSRGWFPAIGNKWLYNIAIQGREIWLAPDAAVSKP